MLQKRRVENIETCPKVNKKKQWYYGWQQDKSLSVDKKLLKIKTLHNKMLTHVLFRLVLLKNFFSFHANTYKLCFRQIWAHF